MYAQMRNLPYVRRRLRCQSCMDFVWWFPFPVLADRQMIDTASKRHLSTWKRILGGENNSWVLRNQRRRKHQLVKNKLRWRLKVNVLSTKLKYCLVFFKNPDLLHTTTTERNTCKEIISYSIDSAIQGDLTD